jgi:tRNA (cytidine56-2'-O)-methyltransferase
VIELITFEVWLVLIVLRLGHRKQRDKRVSTHVGLVARAFGASKIIYCGERDDALLESLEKVAAQWGGKFKAVYSANALKELKKLKQKGFKVVHLTMYGLPFQEKLGEARKAKKIVVVVGAEKVPREFYFESNWNLSVGRQPHSEVAALAVFLYSLNPRALEKEFSKARKKIVPCERGKKVEHLNNA